MHLTVQNGYNSCYSKIATLLQSIPTLRFQEICPYRQAYIFYQAVEILVREKTDAVHPII